MKVVNIYAIYKGKGELTELDSERDIFIVSILRTILMKMIYEEKYQIIDKSISDSNIGARKRRIFAIIFSLSIQLYMMF